MEKICKTTQNQLIKYAFQLWNEIYYAYEQAIQSSEKNFYYKSIAFNIYLLCAILSKKRITVSELNTDYVKDLRDIIAHIDEKIDEPINQVDINNLPTTQAVIKPGQISDITISDADMEINDDGASISSPLGVYNGIIFSSLTPNVKKNNKGNVKKDSDGNDIQYGSAKYKKNGFCYLKIDESLLKSIYEQINSLSVE